jgi:hypothetical protein
MDLKKTKTCNTNYVNIAIFMFGNIRISGVNGYLFKIYKGTHKTEQHNMKYSILSYI